MEIFDAIEKNFELQKRALLKKTNCLKCGQIRKTDYRLGCLSKILRIAEAAIIFNIIIEWLNQTNHKKIDVISYFAPPKLSLK